MVEEEVVEEEDDIIVGESSEYTPKSDFSKGILALEAFRKCFQLRSVEMRSGYTNSKTDKFGNTTQDWIGDSRIAYISSVEGLRCLLSPEIDVVKGMKTVIKDIETEKKDCFNNYAYEERFLKTKDKVELGIPSTVWAKSGKKFIPEKDAMVCIVNPTTRKGEIVSGGWNNYIHAYWEEMLVIYDKLFSALNRLCSRHEINYFKTKMGHEN